MRVQKDQDALLRLTVDGYDGELIAPDELPLLTVVGSNGSEVETGAVTEVTPGYYTAQLPPQPDFDVLVANWTIAVSGNTRRVREPIVIVAERLVPIRELAADPKISQHISGGAAYARLADQIEQWMNRILTFPYCEEQFTAVFRAASSRRELRVPRVFFPRTVKRVSLNGDPWTSEQVESIVAVQNALELQGNAANAFLTGVNPATADRWPAGRYAVTGTHGPPAHWDEIPGDLRRAGQILARYAARVTNYSERARQIATDGALITFSMPDANRPTGLPEVDAAVTAHALRHFV